MSTSQPNDTHQKALSINLDALIYGTLVQQANLWAYVDNFRMLAGLSLIAIPLVFLFKRAQSRAGAAAAH